MRKFLPQRDVSVRADRTGPPRLSATERRALNTVKDSNLRRVLGEMLLRSRDVQENFEAIEGLFPIQPADVANSILEPSEPPASTLSIAPRGTIELFEFSLAKGSGTLQFLPFQEGFLFSHYAVFAVTEGEIEKFAPLSSASISGVGSTSVAVTATSSEEGPAAIVFLGTMSAGARLGVGAGPRLLKVERSAAVNTGAITKIVLALLSTGGPCSLSGSSAGSDSDENFSINAGALGITTDFQVGIYSRGDTSLPTARSDTLVAELTGQAQAIKGRAGMQIFFPTRAEREAAGTHAFTWTFPTKAKGRLATTSGVLAT